MINKLTPIRLDIETKKAIEEAANLNGITQTAFIKMAIANQLKIDKDFHSWYRGQTKI